MYHLVLRKWGGFFICGLFLIPCSITLQFSFGDTGYSEYSLRQIIRGDSCPSDCWQDIEPGVSTLSNVDDLLRNISIHPYIGRNIENGSPITYGWEYPETILLPDESERQRHVVTSFSGNGTVLRVIILTDLCLTTVVSEYGVPEVILESAYGYPSLVYAHEHLYFTTDKNSRIDSIIKTAGENDLPQGSYISWEDYSSNNLDDLCIDGFSYQGIEMR